MPTDLPPRRPAPPGTQPMNPSALRPSASVVTATAPATAPGDRFAALRERVNSDAVSRDLWTLIRRRADAAVADPKAMDLTPAASGFILGSVRAAQGRVMSCALAYRLTDEPAYLACARRELLTLAALPNWCPAHFLDVGESSLAAAIGLDWLGAALAADDRDRIERAIVENALKPSLEQDDGPNSWVRGDFNWNPVCHAGLIAGALVVAAREPALSTRIVDRAIDGLPHAGATYAPDGGFPEGPSYWAYGTTFFVLAIESLRAARRDDAAGLAVMPGFLKTADFNLHMRGPTGADFNYADYHQRHAPEPVMAWFARELRRPDLIESEAADLRALVDRDDRPLGESARFLPFELLWLDPTLSATPPSSPRAKAWTAGGKAIGLAAFRTAWGDPRATYIAAKGGTPNGSHAHMDVGSFVLDADGVRWAIDLGTESYDRMRAAKLDLWDYAPDSSRWTTFRCGPASHNVLRFDAGLQRSAGFAPVAPAKADAGSIGAATIDLGSIYADAATAVTRRVELHADRSVTIADVWTAGPRDVAVAWQWLTRAEATIVPGGVQLKQSGESLSLRIDSASPLTIAFDDVSQPLAPQDSPNPGVTRIVVSLKTAANASGSLTVRAVPGGA